MNNLCYKVIYYSEFLCGNNEHHAYFSTVEAALSRASFHIQCYWIHRVEVWKGDFRLLLAVN